MFNNLHFPGKDSITTKRQSTRDNRYVGGTYRRDETVEVLVNATRSTTETFVQGLTRIWRKPRVTTSEIRALTSGADPRVITRVTVEWMDLDAT